MPGARSSVHAATEVSVAPRGQSSSKTGPWPAVVAAALLLLALGLVLAWAPRADHRPPAAAARHRLASPGHGLSSLPQAAQGPISGALGADDPAYRVRGTAMGLRASNPAQRLRESFAPGGVEVISGRTRLGLSVRSLSYGAYVRALPAVAPRAKANRVTYAYPALSEWYVNGPLGLEQGFTIPRAPSSRPSDALTLSFALTGNAHASLRAEGQSLTLRHAGDPALHYGGLRVADARGRTLHSWLELRGGGVLLRADTRGARYPIHIDPFIQQGEKLSGTGQSGAVAPGFAYSVALSSNGNSALIGGPEDYGHTGAAWVFKREAGTWSQLGSKLTGAGETGEGRFGASVALSPEGKTALIGAPDDNNSTGAAWVFTRPSETSASWSQQAKLTGSGEVGASAFGSSAALSAEGTLTTAVIGGPGDARNSAETEGEITEGSTKVKNLLSTSGVEAGSEISGAHIEPGTTVVSVSGKELTMSTPAEVANIELEETPYGTVKEKLAFATDVGAAWVFTRSGSTWSQQTKIVEPVNGSTKEEIGSGELGSSVAVSADGNTALLGGPGDKAGAGAAWVMTRSGSTWTQQGAKLTGKEEVTSEGNPGEFGASVALTAGSGGPTTAATALVGGPGDNKGFGAAWFFTRASGKSVWVAQGAKFTGSGEVSEEPGEGKFPGQFGASVALSAEGTITTALMGGPGDNKGVGAAWVFTRSGTTWTPQGSKLTGGGEISEVLAPGEFGLSVALSADGNTGLMGGPGDNADVGAAWAFLRSGSTWTQQGSKLTGTGASARSAGAQGSSVALSSDGNTALIGGPKDGNGAAWVFTRSGATWTQQGEKLTGGEEVGIGAARFGSSVALSSDGNTALIGGPGDNIGVGAAWAFTRSEGKWTQQGPKLTASDEAEEGQFGTSVALSSDGNTALIGGRDDNNLAGAAWVFARSPEGKWTQQGSKLTGSGGFFANFGSSVALSSDGNTALVGGPVDGGIGAGAVWVFTRSPEGKWTQQGSKLTGTGGSGAARFGTSVSLSSDGNTALVGGPSDNGEVGAAWAFTRSEGKWTQQGAKLTATGESGAGKFGTSVALLSEGNVALIGGSADNGAVGAAWVFTRSSETWSQPGAKLTPTGESGKGKFGSSVALSHGTALIGGRGDYELTGASWAFVQTPPVAVTEAASGVGAGSATLHATVNPTGSPVSECKFEYGTTEAYGQSVPCASSPGSGEGPVSVSATPTRLAGNTTFHFRISATNAGGTSTGADQTFKTLGPPTVVTEGASAVAQTSATVHGSVNPNGVEVTECVFEYGPTTSYGESAPCTPPPGSGTSPVAVSAALESLAENTTYHFRVSADGNSFGGDQTFTTTLVLGPHWYKNGVKLVAGKGLPVLTWGRLTLMNSSVGALECQTAGGGQLENPSGGGAGKGSMQGFIAYGCVAPACESVGGKAELVPEKLPWSAVAIEEAPLFRDKLEGIALRAICVAANQNVQFHGSLKPQFINGTTQGAGPALLEFGAGSGSLESSAGAGEVKGTMRLFGFSEGQITQLRNP